jgi:hypothetical protein
MKRRVVGGRDVTRRSRRRSSCSACTSPASLCILALALTTLLAPRAWLLLCNAGLLDLDRLNDLGDGITLALGDKGSRLVS